MTVIGNASAHIVRDLIHILTGLVAGVVALINIVIKHALGANIDVRDRMTLFRNIVVL